MTGCAPGTLIALLLLAGPLSVAAQEPAPAGANVEGLEIGESIDVRVVNVEAVVARSTTSGSRCAAPGCASGRAAATATR